MWNIRVFIIRPFHPLQRRTRCLKTCSIGESPLWRGFCMAPKPATTLSRHTRTAKLPATTFQMYWSQDVGQVESPRGNQGRSASSPGAYGLKASSYGAQHGQPRLATPNACLSNFGTPICCLFIIVCLSTLLYFCHAICHVIIFHLDKYIYIVFTKLNFEHFGIVSPIPTIDSAQLRCQRERGHSFRELRAPIASRRTDFVLKTWI